MRVLQRLLLILGIVCLVLYCLFTVQSGFRQADLERDLQTRLMPATYVSLMPGPSPTKTPNRMKEGDLVGRLEVPRLDLSVMVMEGAGLDVLRLGAGHVPGTAFPGTAGNSGIAAHRDTFFRSLRNIQKNDAIRFTTPDGVIEYRVAATMIVLPTDVDVLKPTSNEMLTLVTCYPFYYVGPAPKRFIVQAVRAS